MTRLLASADLHGDVQVYRWLLGIAREHTVDVIILAGDLLGYSDEVEDPLEDQKINAQAVREILLAGGTPMFFVMGNDDLCELEPSTDRLIPLHGRRLDWKDVNFVGYQYSPRWMGGQFEKSDEEIAVDLGLLKGHLDSQTVLVTHSPAYGIRDPGFGRTKIGSRALRGLLEDTKVRAHVHGHSHGGFGRDSYHFNVASARKKRAMVIDLNTMIHKEVRES